MSDIFEEHNFLRLTFNGTISSGQPSGCALQSKHQLGNPDLAGLLANSHSQASNSAKPVVLVCFLLDILCTQLRELFLNMSSDHVDELLPILFGTNCNNQTIEATPVICGLGESPNKTDEDVQIGLVVE